MSKKQADQATDSAFSPSPKQGPVLVYRRSTPQEGVPASTIRPMIVHNAPQYNELSELPQESFGQELDLELEQGELCSRCQIHPAGLNGFCEQCTTLQNSLAKIANKLYTPHTNLPTSGPELPAKRNSRKTPEPLLGFQGTQRTTAGTSSSAELPRSLDIPSRSLLEELLEEVKQIQEPTKSPKQPSPQEKRTPSAAEQKPSSTPPHHPIPGTPQATAPQPTHNARPAHTLPREGSAANAFPAPSTSPASSPQALPEYLEKALARPLSSEPQSAQDSPSAADWASDWASSTDHPQVFFPGAGSRSAPYEKNKHSTPPTQASNEEVDLLLQDLIHHVESAPATPKSPSQSKKKLWVGIILGLLLLGGFAATWYFLQHQ